MKGKFSIAFSLAIILALVVATGVFADTVQVDNDIYSTGNQNIVEINVAPGSIVTTSAQVVVTNSGTKHLKDGSTLIFSVAQNQTTLPEGYEVTDISISVPNPWENNGQQVVGTSSISFTAPTTAGVYHYSVKWLDTSKVCEQNGCLTGGAAFNIDLTVEEPLPPADTTAPLIIPYIAGTLGSNGWYTSDVTISWVVSDPESIITSKIGCDSTTLTEETTGTTLTCSATSAGGTSSESVTIKIDKYGPALNIVGAPSGDSGICSGLPSEPSFSPTDAFSGVDTSNKSWTPSGIPSGVGTYTYTATATDLAGNQTSETRTYEVTYGDAFQGFFQPINMDGSSVFKLTSTIPVKFSLSCNGISITNADVRLRIGQIDSSPNAGSLEAISTSAATEGTQFRYTDSQYLFNLSTKKGYTNPGGGVSTFSQGSWFLYAVLDDGSIKMVGIQLKK